MRSGGGGTTPRAIAAAASSAVRLPLNLSGAITTRIAPAPIRLARPLAAPHGVLREHVQGLRRQHGSIAADHQPALGGRSALAQAQRPRFDRCGISKHDFLALN